MDPLGGERGPDESVWGCARLFHLGAVWSAGPKRPRTAEDDPAGGGAQRLGAAGAEDNRFCGDGEAQGAALPAPPPRWRGAPLSWRCERVWVKPGPQLCCFQVFVSKDVARHSGFLTAEAALRGFYPRVRHGWLKSVLPWLSDLPVAFLSCLCRLRAVLICAWAEKGADALGPDGRIIHSDAFPPESLLDTLGAGDTFNAAVIYTLSNGETPAARGRPRNGCYGLTQ